MDKQARIRVMTVDDHEIMRGGIRFVLLAFDDIELVAEARSGEEAVRLCAEAKPEVVLMDMKMPGMDGVATTKAVKEVWPAAQVLILTSFHDTDLVKRAMQAGAAGYVLKDTSKDELANAIRAAKSGRTILCPEAAEDLVGANEGAAQELTDREREVLVLLAQGLSNNQIAKRIHRSPFTVRHHVSQVILKLGAANRAEAAALAGQRGFLD
jgi:NarL family two-component system response regulator LiaR